MDVSTKLDMTLLVRNNHVSMATELPPAADEDSNDLIKSSRINQLRIVQPLHEAAGVTFPPSAWHHGVMSTSHLQHGLPVGVELHDRLRPLHHGFSSGDFDALVFESTHPKLPGVVPPHCGRRPRALHGRLPPVLEPHDRPADTPGSEVKDRVSNKLYIQLQHIALNHEAAKCLIMWSVFGAWQTPVFILSKCLKTCFIHFYFLSCLNQNSSECIHF